MAKVTIAEVAKKAGVSKSAISHFFNDRVEHLGEDTRKKILKVVKATNYRPDYLARSLRTKQTRNIGVMMPSLTSADYVNHEIEGLSKIAWNHGYNLMINCSHGNDATEEMYFSEMRNRGVDGIVMISPSHIIRDLAFIRNAIDEGFPFVAIDEFHGLDCNYCGIDRREGGRIAADHLAALGHRNVLYLRGSMTSFRAKNRFDGFTEGWKTNGMDPNSVKVIEIYDVFSEKEDLKRKLKQVLMTQPRPTAVFSTDTFSLVAMKAASSIGLRIPEDLSVIGYDNLNWTEDLTPALTTVGYPKKEVGEEAFNILMEQIQNPGETLTQKLLKPFLVIRESCGFLQGG